MEQKRTLSLLVDNTPGLLSRVAGLFSRRGYNIETITAGVTADPRYTRMTVVLYCSDEMYDFLNAIPMDELADLFIVSHVDLVEGEGGVKGLVEGLGVAAAHAAGNKCLRCWKYEPSVGEDGLCPRCAKVLKQ